MLDELADVLVEAVGSGDERKVAAARRIVQALTGGRIVISQEGEPTAKRGWLRGSFTLRLLRCALDEAGGTGPEGDRGIPTHVDFRKPTGAEELADEAKALWDRTGPELLVRQISSELSKSRGTKIGRNLVAKALAHWFTSRGLPVPDGRSRRATLAKKSLVDLPYQAIADRAMELFDQGVLLGEIADTLDVDRNTITAAVRWWHEQRGLAVPDGRSRRKILDRKSRPRSPDAGGGCEAA
jgi:hypothetical protein